MSLLLSGVRVLIAEGPGAALAADLLREQGAIPVLGSGSGPCSGRDLAAATGHEDDPAADHRGEDAATQGVALVRIPAGTAPSTASSLLQWAKSQGIPVDDRRGSTMNVSGPGVGEVVLVGGGPGDPDLVTIAGAREIATADVILSDHLGPVSLAEEAAARGAELIDVAKIPYSRQVAQERINELMVEHARQGKKVVRLKGGDAFIFGRGFEEVEACASAGIPVRVIPGVTSMTSAPAAAGISLTHRGLNHDVTLVSGHLPPESPKSLVNWDAVASMSGTLVLIMAVKNAGAIAQALMDRGRDPHCPATVIENASTPQQRVTLATVETLGDTVESCGLAAPAVIVIGPAAGRRAVATPRG